MRVDSDSVWVSDGDGGKWQAFAYILRGGVNGMVLTNLSESFSIDRVITMLSAGPGYLTLLSSKEETAFYLGQGWGNGSCLWWEAPSNY